MFSDRTQTKLNQLVEVYPRKRSALIPMLLVAQQEHGWVKPETITYIAGVLDMSPSDVDSVASFYTLLHRRPVGKHIIQVCTNLSCMLCGSDDIERTLEKQLEIKVGETTPDGLFTLIEAECLGSCTTAPVVQINGEFREDMNSKKVEILLDELRKNS
jgi:NADH dehydrogenase (ubiquinone) flavoprotein 2